MNSVGLVTIGQSPRTDITPDIASHLPDDVDIVETGALDRFESASAVRDEVGPRADEPVFVTRLRDGSSVKVDRESVVELARSRVAEMEPEVPVVGLLCTGDFPAFGVGVPVLEPGDLLRSWVDGIVADGTLGVVVPEPDQLEQTYQKWSDFNIVTATGSPYDEETDMTDAAESIGTGTDLVVMDCMGYTPEMKDAVRQSTQTGVLLGRSVLAKTATEVL
jgi:protein AroM